MSDPGSFQLLMDLPVRPHKAGLFVSRGENTHPTRVIDSHELIFVRSGVLDMFEEQRHFKIHAGEMLHLWPGRQHGGTERYPADLSFYWLHFRTVADEPRAKSKPHPFMLALAQHVKIGRPERMTELMRRFLNDQESGRLTTLSGSLLVTQIIEEATGPGAPVANSISRAEAMAVRADEYILTHFHKPITTMDVATWMSCNPDYLGRVYRRTRHVTLTESINRSRLQYARKLLMDSVLNVDEVARASGFQDAGYFRRVFRRTEGVSPSTFRRSYARIHLNTE